MTRPPTGADTRVLEAIRALTDEHGYSPTVRELCARTGRSPSTVHSHLRKLQSKGHITWNPRTPRTIRIR